MAQEIILPKLGNTVEECMIKLWHKHVGDAVAVDEVLCEVETDKTTVDVVSTDAGIVRHIFYEENAVVKVLQPIAIVGSADEDISSLVSAHTAAQSAPATTATTADTADTASQQKVAEDVSIPSSEPSSESQKQVRSFSPRARALLKKKGLSVAQFIRHFPVKDLRMDNASAVVEEKNLEYFFSHHIAHITPAAIHMLITQDRFLNITQGSGIHNAIVEQDVIALPTCDEVRAQTPAMSEEYERTPLRGVRKVISTRMMHSLHTTAQYTLHTEARAKTIREVRNQYKHDAVPITLNDIILYLVARVLHNNLWVNAILEDDTVISYRDVNLGCAVQTPAGLMVPVISCAQSKSLEEISQEMKVLITESKTATISPDKFQNGTFTVSNLGYFGVHAFTPILNVPQTGILGVGAIHAGMTEQPNGDYVGEPYMSLSLTLDHRVHDGAAGAQLLKEFAFAIEQCTIEQ